METCKISGCSNPVKAKQLCSKHHQRLRRTGRYDLRRERQDHICSEPGCGNKYHARSLCKKHYQRWFYSKQKKAVYPVFANFIRLRFNAQ